MKALCRVSKAARTKGDETFSIHRMENLPVELFQAVLTIIALQDGNDYTTPRDPLRNLMNVSHVCSQWRAIALQASEAWAALHLDVHSTCTPWLEEILRRTRGQPLNISTTIVDNGRDYSSPQWVMTFNEFHRIETISIIIEEVIPLEPLEKVLGQPAPLLRQFELKYDPDDYISDSFPEEMRLCPSGPLFASHAPWLRALELNHCYIDLRCQAVSNLTALLYVTTPQADDARLHARQWGEALSYMPNLEELYLFFIADGPPCSVHVQLKKLRMLWLMGNHRNVQALYSGLDVPDICDTTLSTTIDGTPEVFGEVGSLLVQEAFNSLPYHHMAFKSTESAFSVGARHGNTKRCTKRSFTDSNLAPLREHYLSRLLRSLSRRGSLLASNTRIGLTALQLDFDVRYPDDPGDREELCGDLAHFMSMFPRVESLALGSPTIKTVIIPIFQQWPPTLWTEDEDLYRAAPILFPSLKELIAPVEVLEDDHMRAIVESYALWRKDMGLPILVIYRDDVPIY
ncbi:hypothetical protein DFP72DRAFT_896394 [Ephemerocybe angulata]|uniref:F-box domain-containing protein n=1 Tax=Ephemerocybe angulata TaxID=980116 RepID=A0A8H6I0S6_9AGAR|nr:hypothetical protein DFP72DRAFT_896394 [Tulosesus angulatus]